MYRALVGVTSGLTGQQRAAAVELLTRSERAEAAAVELLTGSERAEAAAVLQPPAAVRTREAAPRAPTRSGLPCRDGPGD